MQLLEALDRLESVSRCIPAERKPHRAEPSNGIEIMR